MIIGSPSGIGDFSWLWSKLYGIRDQITEIEIADGAPYRTVPYVELCLTPEERKRIKVSYGDFQYNTILMNMMVYSLHYLRQRSPITWAKVLKAHCPDGPLSTTRILLEPNTHLEAGRRLETWLPDLDTEFHYPLYTTAADARHAKEHLDRELRATNYQGKPLLGISCASNGGQKNWRTWSREEWVEFLQGTIDLGWQPVVIGGHWDDLSHYVCRELNLPDLVGKTNVPEMVEILRYLPSFICFSSGLNVIRTILKKPVMCLWPQCGVTDQDLLRHSWVPPGMEDSGEYVSHLWAPVEVVWPLAKDFLERCLYDTNKVAVSQ